MAEMADFICHQISCENKPHYQVVSVRREVIFTHSHFSPSHTNLPQCCHRQVEFEWHKISNLFSNVFTILIKIILTVNRSAAANQCQTSYGQHCFFYADYSDMAKTLKTFYVSNKIYLLNTKPLPAYPGSRPRSYDVQHRCHPEVSETRNMQTKYNRCTLSRLKVGGKDYRPFVQLYFQKS